jgi:hypothetical protein
VSLPRGIARHVATALVLLCLQAMATAMTLRRDPLDRFQAAAISGLVWWSLERARPRPPWAARR